MLGEDVRGGFTVGELLRRVLGVLLGGVSVGVIVEAGTGKAVGATVVIGAGRLHLAPAPPSTPIY